MVAICEVICQNRGSGPGGRLRWDELESLVPIDDAHFFLDKVAAQRVNRIAKARRATPGIQYLVETSCSAVLHPPKYRVYPGGKPVANVRAQASLHAKAKALALAESVAHKVGVHTPIVIIGRSGIGKSPPNQH